jgi:diamine N-acetyltransferase
MPIFLRALEPEDLELLYTIENEPELWAVNTNTEPYSRFALRKYIAEQPNNIYQSGTLRLIICKKCDNSAIGIVDLFDFSPTHNRAEVAIALLSSERQKGYGTIALRSLEDYARKKLRLRMLYAFISASHNEESQKCFNSAGYRNVATLPKWHYNGEEYENVSFFQLFL